MKSRTALRLAGLISLVLLGGCASLVPHRGQSPGCVAQTPEGLYALTLHSPDTGSLTALIAADPVDADGAFRANSRPGALGDFVGGWRGFFANLTAKGRYAGGACLHWSGQYDAAGNHLEGKLVTPLAVLRTAGPWNADGIKLITADGAEAGWMDLQPASPGEHPRTHLHELASAVEDCMRAHLYDPTLVDSRAVRGFFRHLQRTARVARDDAEFLMGAWIAGTKLPFTHCSLYRRLESPATPPAVAAESDPPPPVFVEFLDSGAVLRIDSFAIPEPAIHDAFAQIAARQPPALVIDLRQNPGGSYVAMQVAAHLIAAPMDGGVLFGPRARADVLAGDLAAYPRVAQIASVSELYDLLDRHGAIVGKIEPAEPRFSGPVAVLISNRTASACEPLAYHLQKSGRARIIGERSAGAMLSAKPFDVGQGWSLNLPVCDYITADGVRLEGRGIIPDVERTGEDLPQYALQLLHAQSQPE